jgi:hypothetical protein
MSSYNKNEPSWLSEENDELKQNGYDDQVANEEKIPFNQDRDEENDLNEKTKLTSSRNKVKKKDDDNEESAPRRSISCYCWFRVLHAVAAVICLSGFSFNITTIIYENFKLVSLRDNIIRLYTLVFFIVMVCVELDVKYVAKRFKFLGYWFARGLFYIFLAAVTGRH